MKIVFILHDISGYGGIEKQISLLANSLIHNHEIHIISLRQEFDIMAFNFSDKIKFHFIYKYRIFKFRSLLKSIQPDHITSYEYDSNFINMIAGFGFKKSVGMHVPFSTINRKSKKLYQFLANRLADKQIFVSQGECNKSLAKNKICLYNPIYSEACNIQDKEKIILCVGRFDMQKGFDILLKNLDQVNLSNWKVVMLGKGPEEAKLKKLAGGRVEFPGYMNPIDYYKKASIFVFPSRYEGFGNALAEAMNHGCACLSFNCPEGPSEIIDHNKTGVLVDNGNEEILIQELNSLISDIDRRTLLMEQALLDKRFSLANHEKKFLDMIESI